MTQQVQPEFGRPHDPRAGAFQGVRIARRNEVAEDYVELIAELIHVHGEARPVDIATRIGVTAPTVAKTLDRLARDGLITREKYRSVFLTQEGRTLAEECRAQCKTLGLPDHHATPVFLEQLIAAPDAEKRKAIIEDRRGAVLAERVRHQTPNAPPVVPEKGKEGGGSKEINEGEQKAFDRGLQVFLNKWGA